MRKLAGVLAVALLSMGCGGAVDEAQDSDELEAKLDLENGISPNGLGDNGLNSNGLNGNGLNGNGLKALGAVTAFKDWLGCSGTTYTQRLKVMQYLAGCALALGDSMTVTNSCGVKSTFGGHLGLASNWTTRAPYESERRKVSACLLARVNTAGQHVQLSMRGVNIRVTYTESQNFPVYEGAFFGDIFSTTGVKKLNCRGDRWRNNGRTCEKDPTSCAQVGIGSCSSYCTKVPNAAGSEDLNCSYNGVTYPAVYVHLSGSADLLTY